MISVSSHTMMHLNLAWLEKKQDTGRQQSRAKLENYNHKQTVNWLNYYIIACGSPGLPILNSEVLSPFVMATRAKSTYSPSKGKGTKR